MRTLLPLLCCALAAASAAAQVVVAVDAAAPRVPVSPALYGIFFEEINHAGEGGLYAEMVLNRDLEIVNLPAGATWAGNLLRTRDGWQERKWFGNSLHGWKLTAEGGAQGAIHLETAAPLNERNPHSLHLTVKRAGSRAGVVNRGFSGMNFQKGKSYDLTFWARTAGDARFGVTAVLESASGKERYAAAIIPGGVGGPWKQYRCTLQARDSDADGRLALTVDRPGDVWFDVVSLFPRETFRGRPNGMRADIAKMLAGLHPAFLRFPGGAVVGGLNLDNRFQWKNSLGPIEQRKGSMNLWGYYSTNGLGYHEYLQLAEDLGADALYVCNPGFSDNYRHAEYAPAGDIPAFVQDTLDAIEYALGPVASKWGGERAKNGHPVPFPLKYIEIGNEATGQRYRDSYRLFAAAIRQHYPNLVIISNVRDRDLTMDMVDDHKYGAPESFYRDVAKYDLADRGGPKVYVGEYGCTQNVGEGNLTAALAEAVYMMGLERNGDVVKMASFAPLLFHVDDIAWPVNLIGFDSSRVFGRSSYYVQQLFARHRPDEVLAGGVEQSANVYALAGYARQKGEAVFKLVNRAATPQPVKFQLSGFSQVGTKGTLTVLGHSDAGAENSIEEPDAIRPVETEIAFSGALTLAPNSLTILRVPAR